MKLITVFDGGYMAVSSLYALLLASGYNPVQSVGFASLAFVPIIQHYFKSLPDGGATSKKVMGIDATVLGYVAVVLMSALTVGTLQDAAGAPADTPAD